MAILIAFLNAILFLASCSGNNELQDLKTEFYEFKALSNEKFEKLEAEHVKKDGEIKNLKEENFKLGKEIHTEL